MATSSREALNGQPADPIRILHTYFHDNSDEEIQRILEGSGGSIEVLYYAWQKNQEMTGSDETIEKTVFTGENAYRRAVLFLETLPDMQKTTPIILAFDDPVKPAERYIHVMMPIWMAHTYLCRETAPFDGSMIAVLSSHWKGKECTIYRGNTRGILSFAFWTLDSGNSRQGIWFHTNMCQRALGKVVGVSDVDLEELCPGKPDLPEEEFRMFTEIIEALRM